MDFKWLRMVYILFRAYAQYKNRKEEEDRAAKEFEIRVRQFFKLLGWTGIGLSFLSFILVIIKYRSLMLENRHYRLKEKTDKE